MEFPLTAPCPQCGAEMEPRGRARRGRAVYVCPDCGYEMEMDLLEEAAPEDEEPEDGDR
ncbi:MAG: hypothetical protein QN173_06225 [Armatimonadota bacterium]|nr:hypothetical protein [Armatimonadota bacterium]MDR7401788.1 hypothetical protein [Armatimonadota bacterium]MDR7403090.1 hypothetical protein [Armatimonadota bacterium]MDR7436207.1 hypothetical protein [Armatimonadota bacterium]MDR7471412.1 hypothetical protein [Armatimonadota bacterium]